MTVCLEPVGPAPPGPVRVLPGTDAQFDSGGLASLLFFSFLSVFPSLSLSLSLSFPFFSGRFLKAS